MQVSVSVFITVFSVLLGCSCRFALLESCDLLSRGLLQVVIDLLLGIIVEIVVVLWLFCRDSGRLFKCLFSQVFVCLCVCYSSWLCGAMP